MSKYLAVKNWDKYQGSYTGKYIRDYTCQRDDEEISSLSFYEIGVLQELRRLRGRSGYNIYNDITHIARATHAKATDRPHLRHAIDTLISRGLLVPTDQQLSIEKKPIKRREEKRVEENKEPKTICASPSSAPPLDVLLFLPLNKGEFAIEEADFCRWKELYPAVDVMVELRKMVGWLDGHPQKRKTRSGVKAFINRWLAKAQDNPKAAEEFGNGQPRQVSKADAREQRILERAARFASPAQPLGAVDSQSSSALAVSGNGRSGVCGLAGDAELIPPERHTASPRPAYAAATKAGVT